MSEKSDAKRKQLIYADLNFISNHTLEDIAQGLQERARHPVQATIIQQDEDTALFHLQISRKNHVTASVNGRLKRWAGQMTHVYADGEAYKRHNWQQAGRNFLQKPTQFMSVWLILVGLAITLLANGIAATFSLLMLTLLFFSIFVYAVWLVIQHYLIPLRVQFKDTHISKPEAKDRDRLLDLLVEVIRDDTAVTQHTSPLVQNQPLDDDEIAILLEASSNTRYNTI